MSTQDLLAELPRPSADDQEQIAKALCDLKAEQQVITPPAASEPCTAGLHAGAWTIAEDFDEPAAELPVTAASQSAPDASRVDATILYDPTQPASEDE